MGIIPNIHPKLFTLSAVSVGIFLISDLDSTEQNALGNWLMLVAQVLCTNAYYLDYLQERSQKYMSDEDTLKMLQKMIEALNNEINSIKKSN